MALLRVNRYSTRERLVGSAADNAKSQRDGTHRRYPRVRAPERSGGSTRLVVPRARNEVSTRGLTLELTPRGQPYITWLNEWREVARVAISRRDYRIALGIAQRRQSSDSSDATDDQPPAPNPS